jgi:hypothetical protein
MKRKQRLKIKTVVWSAELARRMPGNAITVDVGVGCATAVILVGLQGACRAVIVKAVRMC